MTNQLRSSVLSLLRNCEQVLICCHANPDSDAASSVVATALFLQDQNIHNKIAYQGRVDIGMMADAVDAHLDRVQPSAQSITGYDAIVILDTAVPHQLGKVEKVLDLARREAIPVINIDHHEVNPGFGDFNIIDSAAASTCEVLFDLFTEDGYQINSQMAHVLLRGVFGDTDVLRTFNVTPKTIRVAADLVELGADRLKLIEEGSTLTVKKAKVWAKVLAQIETLPSAANVAYSIADESVMGPDAENEPLLSGVTNFIRDMQGVDLAILFIKRPHEVKISFRSKSSVSAVQIARRFGGGGHYAAAGCEFPGQTIDFAKSRVLAEVTEMLAPL